MSVIAKQCPNEADRTKSNFDKYIWGYRETVTGFPNVGDQLICRLHTAKKPAFMSMHEFMRHQVLLLGYLDGGYIHQTIELPMVQEKNKQILFAQSKVHQYKLREINKMLPVDLLWHIVFFEQCQAANKAAGVLEKIKEKKQL
jgi:hypothetical protein